MPAVTTEASTRSARNEMTQHLKEISTQVAKDAHAALVLDGAGWHHAGGDLQVPDNVSLVPQTVYAPEINQMENVWESLRSSTLCAIVWDTYDVVVEACRKAWAFLFDDPTRIISAGTRDWAAVSGEDGWYNTQSYWLGFIEARQDQGFAVAA